MMKIIHHTSQLNLSCSSSTVINGGGGKMSSEERVDKRAVAHAKEKCVTPRESVDLFPVFGDYTRLR